MKWKIIPGWTLVVLCQISRESVDQTSKRVEIYFGRSGGACVHIPSVGCIIDNWPHWNWSRIDNLCTIDTPMMYRNCLQLGLRPFRDNISQIFPFWFFFSLNVIHKQLCKTKHNITTNIKHKTIQKFRFLQGNIAQLVIINLKNWPKQLKISNFYFNINEKFRTFLASLLKGRVSLNFYWTQVYLGSDLWDGVSQTKKLSHTPFWNFTDWSFISDKDTNSILTDNANRAFQGDVAMQVTTPGG